MLDETDALRVKRLFWPNANDGINKRSVPSRYWNDYDLWDNEPPRRRDNSDTITRGHREGNDTMRIFYRGPLMGMMVEKLRGLLHETMAIFIRNSKNNLRTYLLENIESVTTIEDAVKWAEHLEDAQSEITIPRVSSLAIEEPEDLEEQETHAGQVEAIGRNTGIGSRWGGSRFKGSGRGYNRSMGFANRFAPVRMGNQVSPSAAQSNYQIARPPDMGVADSKIPIATVAVKKDILFVAAFNPGSREYE